MHHSEHNHFTSLTKFLLALCCLCYVNANCQTQLNIYFESGSDRVSAKDKDMLRKLVDGITQKEFAVSVRGYTDTTGTIELNRSLAVKRESAVANILSEFGVDMKSKQIETSCNSGILSDKTASNSENRRVLVTIDELITYSSKNGSVIMAPQHVKLRLIDQSYQFGRVANNYRKKDCHLPLPAEILYSNVAVESAVDTCSFMIVKVPNKEENLPVKYLDKVTYEEDKKTVFRSYTNSNGFKFFKVPLYSDYIILKPIGVPDYFPMTYLNIVLPKQVRPFKATLGNDCITIPVLFKKDTLRAEYDAHAEIDWEILNLTIETRDTVYKVPMSDFDIVFSERYTIGGFFVLRLKNYKAAKYFPKKAIRKKRRTLWQRLGDLFR